ncbi:DUF3325 domain-containing protein [Pseudomonas sichuanensis]
MLSVALLGFAGFAGLCLAMEKHFNDLLGRKPTATVLKALRIGGWSLLLLSLVLAVHLRGLALGLVEWIAVLMAGVTLWVFGLPYQPRLLVGLAAASLVLGPLLAVLAV